MFDLDELLDELKYSKTKDGSIKTVLNKEKDLSFDYQLFCNKEEYIYTFPVVGLSLKDISASIKDGVLEVSCKGSDEITGITYDKSYELHLDDNRYIIEKATAKVQNGLLYVIIPKAHTSKKTKALI